MNSVYTVAFDGDRFLMVYNEKRKGWEMPGGRIEPEETEEQAAEREFFEESGYDVELVAKIFGNGCWIFSGVLGKKIAAGEMISAFFTELPDELAFSREEYAGVTEWARSLYEAVVR